MQESNTKIFYTSDYGMFRFLKGNRDLNEGKINKIIKSVNEGLDFFKYCPVMVNENYFIIDGQHRFFACKKLKHPVYYVIVPNFSLRQVAEINNNQSKWKCKDFLNCYIDADVNRADYQLLADFVHEYKIPISYGINLLATGKIGNGGTGEKFQNGEFKVQFQDAARRLMDAVKEYEPYFHEYRQRSFIQAIEKLQQSDKYDQSVVLKKFARHALSITRQSSAKEYMQQIEELYNYHNQNRQTIY